MPLSPIELIAQVRTGVAKLILEDSTHRMLGSGTAFLIENGLVTNSHVLRENHFDTLAVHFDGQTPGNGIRWTHEDIFANLVRHESLNDERDFAVLAVDEPEFHGRHRFQLSPHPKPSVGEQILFLGYPFETFQLTAHLGYISSIHQDAGVDMLQIDGSINSGNSGGPLLRLSDGGVTGIVTRAATGLVRDLWQSLMNSFDANQAAFDRCQAGITIGGINPIEALKVTQNQMKLVSRSLQRSANVGIGYAFSSIYVHEELARNSSGTAG